MKTKPILFQTQMVQALLAGTKTQTRRLVKNPERMEGLVHAGEEQEWCPYGRIGDVLWVRETWAYNPSDLENRFCYRADDIQGWPYMPEDMKWKPSLFMPRDACRLFLEITDVRIERLHDITEADAVAEGIARDYILGDDGQHVPCFVSYTTGHALPTAKMAYKTLWAKINGHDSVKANPWVWVVQFKQVPKPQRP